jgi:hypothetical protein
VIVTYYNDIIIAIIINILHISQLYNILRRKRIESKIVLCLFLNDSYISTKRQSKTICYTQLYDREEGFHRNFISNDRFVRIHSISDQRYRSCTGFNSCSILRSLILCALHKSHSE